MCGFDSHAAVMLHGCIYNHRCYQNAPRRHVLPACLLFGWSVFLRNGDIQTALVFKWGKPVGSFDVICCWLY